MRTSTRRSEKALAHMVFVNALRDCLGLAPIVTEVSEKHFRLEEWEARRFFVAPVSTRPAMTPRRGAGA